MSSLSLAHSLSLSLSLSLSFTNIHPHKHTHMHTISLYALEYLQRGDLVSEWGTCKTVKVRFWPWFCRTKILGGKMGVPSWIGSGLLRAGCWVCFWIQCSISCEHDKDDYGLLMDG